MKILWSPIGSIINIKTKKFCNVSQLVQNGEIVQNLKELAKIFSNYMITLHKKGSTDNHPITDQFSSCPFSVIYLKKLCIGGL